MKFDTIIIGGGLAGLTCGIRLQKKGVKCAIVSAGQSALHFSSGSFDLLNALPDGTPVGNPLEEVAKVGASHPYAKICGKFGLYAAEAKKQLSDCGIAVEGDASANHFRITPMGTLKRTWLTFSDFTALDSENALSGKKVLIATFAGFLDFNTKFVADSFEARGAQCKIIAVNLPEMQRIRKSPTEMRSANIARILENTNTLNALLSTLKENSNGFDVVALPAVFGLNSSEPVKVLKDGLDVPVCLVPTMPPSVPGIRTQQRLRHEFERLGGVYMLGDSVVKAEFNGNRMVCVYTVNHGNIGLSAKTFVLASGSFFSNGLTARPDSIIETTFGFDVDFDADRASWFDQVLFKKQNYMTFGVSTDENFRVKKNGNVQENVYAVGSVLSGFNALHEGCGAGVAMLTALYVADNLKNE